MSLLDYINQFLERGGQIKVIPTGQSTDKQPVPLFWIEEDNSVVGAL